MSKLVLFLFLGVCVAAVQMAPTNNEDSDSDGVILKPDLRFIGINWKKIPKIPRIPIYPVVGARVNWEKINTGINWKKIPKIPRIPISALEDTRVNWKHVASGIGHVAGPIASAAGQAVIKGMIGKYGK